MALLDTLAAPFKQRGIVRGAEIKEQRISYGMCLGLSVDWVIRHRSHKSEGSQKRILYMGTQAPAQSVTGQVGYLTKLRETRETISDGQKDAIDAAFRTRGSGITVRSTTLVRHFQADTDGALQALYNHTASPHHYAIVLLEFDNGGDLHATAAYHSGGKIFGFGSHLYYFEPNFGEFRVSPDGVKTMFRDLAAEYLRYRTRDNTLAPKKLTSIAIDALTIAP